MALPSAVESFSTKEKTFHRPSSPCVRPLRAMAPVRVPGCRDAGMPVRVPVLACTLPTAFTSLPLPQARRPPARRHRGLHLTTILSPADVDGPVVVFPSGHTNWRISRA
jgi:hypothetical protein